MICPVCKQRWAALDSNEAVRKMSFKSNRISCCGSPDCLEVVDAMIAQNSEFGTGVTYDDLVEETEKELAEGKIR